MSKDRFKYSRGRRTKREENNTILIVCCGETESLYFKKFNLDLGQIKIKTITQPESPMLMVGYTLSLMNKQKYRQVWCVFDKDEFRDFDQAILKGQKEGIKIAFSNQAFEYWFILHYERANRTIGRDKYASILSKHIGKSYGKTDSDMYSILKGNMKIAIENARIIHQRHNRQGNCPSRWESCTTVYVLVEELLRWKIE